MAQAQQQKMTFKGYINDGNQAYGYLAFIDELRKLAIAKKGNAVVHFSLNPAEFDDVQKAITFSPKLRINFEENCYIHEIAPTDDGVTFAPFEKVDVVNYPAYVSFI